MNTSLKIVSLMALTFASLAPAHGRDVKAIDISSLKGEPLNEEQISLFLGSWVESHIVGNIEPNDEAKRKSECKYLFGQGLFDDEASEDLEEMSALAPGLTNARGQLFITKDDLGPVIATESTWSTPVEAGDVHRINPATNGWFDVGFYSARWPTKTGDTWGWEQVGSLEEGQVFLNAMYRIRVIQLPSGAVTPLMQDITYGVPTEYGKRSKFLMRCEDVPQPAP